jgi:hypothetical protein
MRELLPCDEEELHSLKCSLPENLQRTLQEAEFAEIGGMVTFAGSSEPNLEARKDLTGLECLLNKWQMDAYIKEPAPSLERVTAVGICYALELKRKLVRSEIAGNLRLIVSCSPAIDESLPNTCTVHLHKLRPENPWLNDDIESYTAQGVLTIDWQNAAASESHTSMD